MTNESRSAWRSLVDGAAGLAMIAASVVLIWVALHNRATLPPAASGANAPLPSEPVSLNGAAVKGDPRARVAIVEYADFQCSFCGQFAADILPQLRSGTSGRAGCCSPIGTFHLSRFIPWR